MSVGSFDERAATWDENPRKVQRAKTVAEAIKANVPLATSMRLLEYGAGTALLTQHLRDAVGPVTASDPSQGMRDVLQEKIDSGVLPNARVWDLDLNRDAIPDDRFDIIVSLMVLHHVDDVGRAINGMAELLDSGGYACLSDLDAEDGSFHSDREFNGHNGFERDEMTKMLTGAGLVDVRIVTAGAVDKEERSYPLFLAIARKP